MEKKVLVFVSYLISIFVLMANFDQYSYIFGQGCFFLTFFLREQPFTATKKNELIITSILFQSLYVKLDRFLRGYCKPISVGDKAIFFLFSSNNATLMKLAPTYIIILFFLCGIPAIILFADRKFQLLSNENKWRLCISSRSQTVVLTRR